MAETPVELNFRVNPHVERLHRYVPLNAGANLLVQELIDVDDPVTIETKAESALLTAALSAGVRLVLLTGDAGHGKTWLCVRLLQSLGRDAVGAGEAIRTQADGNHDLVDLLGGKRLRIVKDLSDFDVFSAAEVVRAALNAEDRVTVICANEGRLRDVVNRDLTELEPLLIRLQEGLRGDAAIDEGVLVLNLNYQSVAADDTPLVGELLGRWLIEPTNWVTCHSCRAQALCPIYENRAASCD